MAQIDRQMLHGVPKNGPTDPIDFYRRPFVGWLYRERINQGFRLLGARRFDAALEVGFGSGIVQLALGPSVDDLHGIDLDADPTSVTALLSRRGVQATLRQGTVYDLPYDDARFDLVVSFSVFEHLHEFDRALDEVARVLKPGGWFLLGMPSVNLMMEVAFRAIGFKGIEDHHVTTPQMVERAFARHGLAVVDAAQLDFPLRKPAGARLYYNWLLEKR